MCGIDLCRHCITEISDANQPDKQGDGLLSSRPGTHCPNSRRVHRKTAMVPATRFTSDYVEVAIQAMETVLSANRSVYAFSAEICICLSDTDSITEQIAYGRWL